MTVSLDPYEQSYPPSLWLNPGGHGGGVHDEPSLPDMTWTKADIIDWIDLHGIMHSASATKAELLALIADG